MRAPALVLALVLGACWRTSPPPPPQQQLSFVARVAAVRELRRGTAELVRQLAAATYRLHGLASEAEREALLADVRELEREVARLAGILAKVRAGGEDPDRLASVARELHEARLAVVELGADARHAKTTAELEAFEQLKRKIEASHDASGSGLYRRLPRDPNATPIFVPRDRAPIELLPLRP